MAAFQPPAKGVTVELPYRSLVLRADPEFEYKNRHQLFYEFSNGREFREDENLHGAYVSSNTTNGPALIPLNGVAAAGRAGAVTQMAPHLSGVGGVGAATHVTGIGTEDDVPMRGLVATGSAGTVVTTPIVGSTFAIGASLVDITSGGATTTIELDYIKSKGGFGVRIPVGWEQIQPVLLGALSSPILADITAVASYCQTIGIKCWVDIHNYARYFPAGSPTAWVLGGPVLPGDSGTLTTAHFGDLMTRLATALLPYAPTASIDMMNEPHDMVGDGPTWTIFAQSGLNAIRAVDTTGSIEVIIEGYHFANTYAWPTVNPDIHTILDPAPKPNITFSGHMYPDPDDSGGDSGFNWDACVAIGDLLDPGTPLDVNTGVKRLTPFINWLAMKGLRGNIGESGIAYVNGVPDNVNWFVQGKNTLDYLKSNNIQVMIWAGGQFWGNYAYSLQPGSWITPSAISDAEQWALLTQYTGAAQPTVYFLTGPSNGSVSTPTSNFSAQYRGVLPSPITITFSDDGSGGSFSPATATLAANVWNPVGTSVYTPSASPVTTLITASSGGALTDPAGIVFSTEVDLFAGLPTPQNIISDIQIYAAYIGPCRNMYRIADGATQDFGFVGQAVGVANLGRVLDTAGIAAWAPGGAKTKVRYDQSPNANHMLPVIDPDASPSTPSDYPVFSIDADGFPVDTFSGSRMDMISSLHFVTGQTIIANFKFTAGSAMLNWDFSSQLEFGPGYVASSGGVCVANIGSIDGGGHLTLSPPGNVMEVYGATAAIGVNTPLSAAGMPGSTYVTGTLPGPDGFPRYQLNASMSLGTNIIKTIYDTVISAGNPDHTNYENGEMAMGVIPGEYHVYAQTWQAATVNGWRTWRDGTLFAKNTTYTTNLADDYTRSIAHLGYSVFGGPSAVFKSRDWIVFNQAIPDANNAAIQNYLANHYATKSNGGLPQAPVSWDIVLDFLNNTYTVSGSSVTMASQCTGATRDSNGLQSSSTANIIGASLAMLAGTAWTMELEFWKGPTTDDGATHALVGFGLGSENLHINYPQSGLYIVSAGGGATGGSESVGINNTDYSLVHRCLVSVGSAGWLMAQNEETYAVSSTPMTTGWTSCALNYFNPLSGLYIRNIKIKATEITLAQAMQETSAIGTAGSPGPQWLPSVQLAGGSFKPTSIWPQPANIAYLAAQGVKGIRVDFLWEFVQTSLDATLDPTQMAAIDALVTQATGLGMTVILDCHNYGAYNGITFGNTGGPTSANLANLWGQIATRYAANSLVAYGIMNEPAASLSEAAWVTLELASLSAIRTAGATGLVLLPSFGNSSQATAMIKNGSAAAIVAAGITDSNFAIEVHQYLDSGGNETSPNVAYRYVGVAQLQAATTWARANGIRLFWGEQGTDWNVNNPLAQTELSEAYQFCAANKDVWLGFSYFAGGAVGIPFWSIQPVGPGTNTGLWAAQPYGERSIMGVLIAAE